MRKCVKGKSCGGTCINKTRKCRAKLNPSVSKQLNKIDSLGIEWIVQKAPKDAGWDVFWDKMDLKPQTADTGGTAYAKVDAQEFDQDFKPKRTYGSTYDWSQSYEKGSKKLGEGSYGTVIASKPPPPLVVKRGEISENEVKILERLSGKDISPDLISAELGAKISESSAFEDKGLFVGRVAMGRVPGEESSEYDSYGTKVGNTTVGDAYWSLRKRLHMEGVAHNDAHRGNVIFDETGKARFVDFGLSQDNPKASLSEAVSFLAKRRFLPTGSVTPRPLNDRTGDWQGSRFSQFSGDGFKNVLKGSNLETIIGNRNKVFSKLKDMGFDNNEIADLFTTGIRNTESVYRAGVWQKLTNDDAKTLIETFYEGVS
jgi:hypothetical protein